jgi:cytochrome c oxidase assembly protein subunit 15
MNNTITTTDFGGPGAPPISDPLLRWLRVWLFMLAAMVLAMVVVGGATRLTHSGLSITEWRPVDGILPPLGDADWQDLFAKYQQIPEYKIENKGMTLAEFKPLFWWEWSHRMLGRVVGIVAAAGLIGFLSQRSIRQRYWKRLAAIFALGALEGAAGWYMVASGLKDRTDVSQYRLALHLGIATLIMGLTLWTALGVGRRRASPANLKTVAGVMAALLAIGIYKQILLGAFVAGLDAGLAYNTWPLMDGRLIPAGVRLMHPVWLNLFENPITVQFNHRLGAYAVAIFALINHIVLWRRGNERLVPSAALVLTAVLLQVGLGIWTLLAVVPLPLGLAHQVMAMLVLASAIVHLHRVLSVEDTAQVLAFPSSSETA